MAPTPPTPEAPSPRLKRDLVIIWLAVVGALGMCLFLGTWWGRQAELSAPAETASTPAGGQATESVGGSPGSVSSPTLAPTSASRVFGYGIQIQGRVNTTETLDQVQQLGLQWVRQPVRWADIEPEPGNLHWELLDDFFLSASSRNLKVLVTISAAPDWARSVTARDYDGPPDDVQAYVNFVTLLLQRYHGAVQAVEVWNEPNRDRDWYAAGGLSAASYLALLGPTADAIHAVAPGVIVISAGLDPTGIDDGITGVDDFHFLRDMLSGGLLGMVDCVGAHHSGYNLPPDAAYDALTPDAALLFQQPYDNPHHSWSFYSTIRGYHDLIVVAGGETPLCVTDFGWASAEGIPQQERDVPQFALDNTERNQADYIVQAFQAMHEWGFVWLAFLSNLDYSPEAGLTPTNDLAIYYRIVRPDGSHRLAFEALQTMPKTP